jgi:hypothetical protein
MMVNTWTKKLITKPKNSLWPMLNTTSGMLFMMTGHLGTFNNNGKISDSAKL